MNDFEVVKRLVGEYKAEFGLSYEDCIQIHLSDIYNWLALKYPE